MAKPVRLLSLATASPPHEITQDQVAELVRTLFAARFPNFERMAPVFRNAGVRTRQLAMPVEWYLEPRSWPERGEAYLDGALDLFCQAAQGALDEAGLTGAEVDAIVTVSSTGIATPSLEARAMTRMGFRPDVARVPVLGVGCAGGATGLALASRLAAAEPGATVLLVCVELCSMAFSLDGLGKADIVSTAIFGDGAAACVVRAGEGGFAQVAGFAEHTWPDTLDIMGWRIDADSLGVVLDRALPPFVRNQMRPVVERMLAGQNLALEDVDRFVCHPGGMKVIEAIEAAFDLGQGSLGQERQVLAEHGNMSSPTVLFILDRVRRANMPRRSVLTAMGPGFTASTVTLLAA
ncbi:MAG: chalcone synthase [Phenylobacterium sp.]|nr:chalcone synthase [Phenylobacterium sp.]